MRGDSFGPDGKAPGPNSGEEKRIFPLTLPANHAKWLNGMFIGCVMFRLTFLLCAGIFLAMVIGGQDRGQLRFGLMQEAAPIAVAVELPKAQDPVVNVAFVPETPVMVQPAVAVAPEEPVVADLAELPEGRILFVAAASANVRQGPGKDHAVVDRLTRGEAVLVVVEGEGANGWSLVRIEGDGLEGYVASRLLSE